VTPLTLPARMNRPALIVAPPVKVFAALSVSVPAPVFVSANPPETGALSAMSPAPPMLAFAARIRTAL